MADFYITAVRYNEDRSRIAWVQVREDRFTEVGPARTVQRAFVADLIRLGKATFQTATRTLTGEWQDGSDVHCVERTYLTTNRNSTKQDNLGNLPEF